jgi:hypothetical protein
LVHKKKKKKKNGKKRVEMSDHMNIEGDSETINSKLQPPTIGEKSDNNSTAG